MEDDGAGERGSSGRGVVVGVARVDHDGSPAQRRSRAAVEDRALHVPRSTVMEVVEPDLADRDHGRVLEQLDQLGIRAGVSSPA